MLNSSVLLQPFVVSTMCTCYQKAYRYRSQKFQKYTKCVTIASFHGDGVLCFHMFHICVSFWHNNFLELEILANEYPQKQMIINLTCCYNLIDVGVHLYQGTITIIKVSTIPIFMPSPPTTSAEKSI